MIYKWIRNASYAVFIILFVLYLFMALNHEAILNRFHDFLLFITYAVFLILVTSILVKQENKSYKIKEKAFLLIIFMTAFLIRFLAVYILEVEQNSDFKTLYNAAVQMVNGNLRIGLDKGSYFYRYNFQIGYTSYLFILMKLFNSTSIYVVYVSNVIWSSLNVILIYYTTKELFSPKSGRIASILLCF